MDVADSQPLPTNHTFVICAYGESEYLEDCVRSVVSQTEPSNLLITTSTDLPHIREIADRYRIGLRVNPGSGTMQDNWNFGLQCAKTDFVTLCHQDDTYACAYYQGIRPYLTDDLLYLHTGYWNMDQERRYRDINNRLRGILNAPLRIRALQRLRWVKRGALRFGNSVCCPSCTYHKTGARTPLFQSALTHGLDWDTYIDLADARGRVAYVAGRLCNKRTHSQSATVSDIRSGVRYREDRYLFSRLWSRKIASLLLALYQKIYKYSL
ncbi:MAG: glycosyltransferase [Clostridiales bacterium]|nr:glycosyltransferase [Clostridiales bacterium]